MLIRPPVSEVENSRTPVGPTEDEAGITGNGSDRLIHSWVSLNRDVIEPQEVVIGIIEVMPQETGNILTFYFGDSVIQGSRRGKHLNDGTGGNGLISHEIPKKPEIGARFDRIGHDH